jgi:cytochrome c553
MAQEAAPPGATSCTGCHAPVGRGGAIPALAGRPAGEIVQAMEAFRSGSRQATVMDRIAKGFSEAETRAIADWFSARR